MFRWLRGLIAKSIDYKTEDSPNDATKKICEKPKVCAFFCCAYLTIKAEHRLVFLLHIRARQSNHYFLVTLASTGNNFHYGRLNIGCRETYYDTKYRLHSLNLLQTVSLDLRPSFTRFCREDWIGRIV